MKFTNCLSSVTFFIYCSVVVLVIVNGQPTANETDDISRLINTVAKLELKIAKLEGQLAASYENVCKLVH